MFLKIITKRLTLLFGLSLIVFGVGWLILQLKYGPFIRPYAYHQPQTTNSSIESTPLNYRPEGGKAPKFPVAALHINSPTIIDTETSGVVEISVSVFDALYESSIPQISLSGAGLDIQPTGFISLTKDQTGTLVARWTIRSKEPGKFNLIVNKSVSDREIRFTPSPVIAVEVKQTVSGYAAEVWPILTTVLGSFLTIPGLIAVFKDRKKDRQD